MRIIFNTQIYTKPNNYSNKNSQISYKARPTKEELEVLLNKGYKNSHWKEERDNYRINKIEKFLSWGYSYKEIADLLDISLRTIRNLMKDKNNK